MRRYYELKKTINTMKNILQKCDNTPGQLLLWKEMTNMGRRTFFRYKKAVKNNDMNEIGGYCRHRKYKLSQCYMCGSERELLVHHNDGNRENNEKYNLTTLCPSCHVKIHRLIKIMMLRLETNKTSIMKI